MRLTRRDFFDAAVEILYREGNGQRLTYEESIEYAKDEFGLTGDDLKRLLTKGINEIDIVLKKQRIN